MTAEPNTSMIASGGMIPTYWMQCDLCGWHEWERSQEWAERAYAKHLNEDKHHRAVAADALRNERIERYRLEDLSQRLLNDHDA